MLHVWVFLLKQTHAYCASKLCPTPCQRVSLPCIQTPDILFHQIQILHLIIQAVDSMLNVLWWTCIPMLVIATGKDFEEHKGNASKRKRCSLQSQEMSTFVQTLLIGKVILCRTIKWICRICMPNLVYSICNNMSIT